jgi:hypothetical protein
MGAKGSREPLRPNFSAELRGALEDALAGAGFGERRCQRHKYLLNAQRSPSQHVAKLVHWRPLRKGAAKDRKNCGMRSEALRSRWPKWQICVYIFDVCDKHICVTHIYAYHTHQICTHIYVCTTYMRINV